MNEQDRIVSDHLHGIDDFLDFTYQLHMRVKKVKQQSNGSVECLTVIDPFYFVPLFMNCLIATCSKYWVFCNLFICLDFRQNFACSGFPWDENVDYFSCCYMNTRFRLTALLIPNSWWKSINCLYFIVVDSPWSNFSGWNCECGIILCSYFDSVWN